MRDPSVPLFACDVWHLTVFGSTVWYMTYENATQFVIKLEKNPLKNNIRKKFLGNYIFQPNWRTNWRTKDDIVVDMGRLWSTGSAFTWRYLPCLLCPLPISFPPPSTPTHHLLSLCLLVLLLTSRNSQKISIIFRFTTSRITSGKNVFKNQNETLVINGFSEEKNKISQATLP